MCARQIPDDVIHGKDRVEAIESAIYKRDPHKVLSFVYEELIRLMNTNESANELFPDFELRFSAQLSRFNATASHTSISNAMASLMLLANSNVDTGQRVSILAAPVPSSDAVNHNDTVNEMLDLVHYEAVVTVKRQYEDQIWSLSRNRMT